ncbi:MAG TPA: GtrA family protein [Candidatus Saccharimonadales bacterium]|nr:GtrA family protein [Candidatus Saccharimonadales bacterium]
MNKMTSIVKELLKQRFIRYLIVGVFTFIIDFGLLFFFRIKLNTGLTLATSIGYWTSVIFNFTLNRFWSFDNKDIKSLHKHALAYAVLLAFNYTFTVIYIRVVTGALTSISSTKSLVIAKVSAVAIQTTWNFFIYRKYIFVKKEHKSTSGYSEVTTPKV